MDPPNPKEHSDLVKQELIKTVLISDAITPANERCSSWSTKLRAHARILKWFARDPNKEPTFATLQKAELIMASIHQKEAMPELFVQLPNKGIQKGHPLFKLCLLYTSDAADE